MADQPLLSFCVLTYNRSLLLTQILDQMIVIKNAFAPGTIEIVVSDNCSTDDTAVLVQQRYAEQGVMLIQQERNIGASRNWLAAIKASAGIYVWPFADDDLLAVEPVIEMIANHLRQRTADFYRTNFIGGYYAGSPRTRAELSQLGHCIDADIIFPDLLSLIPYCGIIPRGLVTYMNILLGDVIRQCDLDDFLPIDGFFDQCEVLIKAFKYRKSALLHRCLVFLLTPQEGPRWLGEVSGGLPGSYVHTIELMRRMVRMIENGTIPRSLIDSDGLLKVYKLADDSYVLGRNRLPHYVFCQTLQFLGEYTAPLDRRDWTAIEDFARYVSDPAIRMLFEAVARHAQMPSPEMLDRLLAFQYQVLHESFVPVWRASKCPMYDDNVGRNFDTTHLGVQEAAYA